MPYEFGTIEKKWQKYWLEKHAFRALEPAEAGDRPKAYVLDMFPYPSGDGLHVGHVIQQTATDILCRHLRMKGVNVLHPMGWDAFGLPAEEYARKNNIHPAISTEKNIDNFRKQIQALGMGYDWEREVNTTDPAYYKWTQWIFLQLFNSYYDRATNKARPIAHLLNELQNENLLVAPDGTCVVNPNQEGLEAISGDVRVERKWIELSEPERQQIIDGHRLAYMAEVAVNWCAGLGTVLANEEVIDGKSERGDFPVERRPLRQWLMRITSYSDRLIADLDQLEWPESLKEMQRNWIGKSEGAEVDFDLADPALVDAGPITVFTTRPDTLFGATYMVLAPEHELVDKITTPAKSLEVDKYRASTAAKSDRERQEGAKDKTGVFTGAYAINPVNDERIPIWIADYVLTGYGTGAIMAVPAHDERDFEFAKKFGIAIKNVVVHADFVKLATSLSPVISGNELNEAIARGDEAITQFAMTDEGIAVHSGFLDGMKTQEAKARMIAYLEDTELGRRRVNYKLRDWLFSRQRYWGEPFPIVLDAQGNAHAIPESELPLILPEMSDFKPTGTPEGPLSKMTEWLKYSPKAVSDFVAAGGDATLTRETNTMPQWAGSCWYYLRYLDPKNADRFVDPEKEKYWMPVDLYVGGVEHAVLHLLYARFWHKALFDLGHLTTNEPFKRLVNQGLILGEMEFHFFEVNAKAISAAEFERIGEEASEKGAVMVGYRKDTGERTIATRVEEILVEKKGDKYVLKANNAIAVDARSFKMSKSRGNVVNPTSIVANYGADAFRLYEMYMGPLEAQKPWNTRDIIGMSRFLNSVGRNIMGDEENHKVAKVQDIPIPEALDQLVHRTIKKVGEDISGMRFNVAIAELIKLNNEVTKLDVVPKKLAETLALLLSPFAPHLAEELWATLGHAPSISKQPWPAFDEAKLAASTMELPVQVNGKLRGKITVDVGAGASDILTAARADVGVVPWIEGKAMKKELYVPGKLVNFVVA